jgi:hypothetical protein
VPGYIYAITEKFPSKETVFNEIPYKDSYEIVLLGSDAKVFAENRDGKLGLKADICSPEDIDSQHLYVFRVK